MISLVSDSVDISFSSLLSKVSGLATCHVGAAVGKGPQLQTDLIEDLFFEEYDMENQIKLADQYAAHFWQAFGARAAMDMDEECVEVARERGYYGHVEGNAVNFDEHSYLLEETLRCARRAGHLAANFAREDGRSIISVEDFTEACVQTEARVAKVRTRLMSSAGRLRAMGGICWGA
jgi:hypothetical protein